MTLKIPKPSPRQELFLTDTHHYIAFGGARGGGKSWAVRIKASLLALHYPGIRIMIVRRTYPELRQNHIMPIIPLLHGIAVYKESTRDMTFNNGSIIAFRYCRNIADLDKFQGTDRKSTRLNSSH